MRGRRSVEAAQTAMLDAAAGGRPLPARAAADFDALGRLHRLAAGTDAMRYWRAYHDLSRGRQLAASMGGVIHQRFEPPWVASALRQHGLDASPEILHAGIGLLRDMEAVELAHLAREQRKARRRAKRRRQEARERAKAGRGRGGLDKTTLRSMANPTLPAETVVDDD